MKKSFLYISLIFTVILLASCSSVKENYYDYEGTSIQLFHVPADLDDSEKQLTTITKYAENLNGRKIFIDQGHGGADRKNKSPNGEVVEADVNLRVALYLKNFLERAGAKVYMSRLEDETVDLKYRSELLNSTEAELFISVHHNAPAKPEQNYVNYTSTYYHAKEKDYEYDHMARDVARYVQRDLSFAMNTSGGLGSFDGTYSDYLIYPGEGFSVLRLADVPAILIECAFFTNPLEEKRLASEKFNEVQAWAIFKGLGKYYMNSHPVVKLLEEESTLTDNSLKLVLQIDDENEIDESSIAVMVNKEKYDFTFDSSENKLEVVIENVEEGDHEIKVLCKNSKKRFSYPFRKQFEVKFD
ncbi:MAG: N-acetylmuramoyl-L-alanine amidase [Rhodothermaceae bacterium]